MTIAEVVRAGKARLIEHGWCQGDELSVHGSPGGPCCAVTAMSTEGLGFEGQLAVSKLFREANGITDHIADWNDAPERTLEEVLAAYDKAITVADLKITADELRAMPMPQAVVAFLRACRTFDEVGDIDGPWRQLADPFLYQAADVPDIDAYFQWTRDHTHAEVFAVHDKAIAAAERHLPACPGPYDWCFYANLCAADDCLRKSGTNS